MAIVWHYLSLAAQVPLFDLDIVPERLEEKQAYLVSTRCRRTFDDGFLFRVPSLDTIPRGWR